MDFAFSEEQDEFRETLQRFFEEKSEVQVQMASEVHRICLSEGETVAILLGIVHLPSA